MKKIIVASKNPVKLNAALSGFQKMFPGEKFEVEGVSVSSGVSDQPRSDEESFTGATNRAKNARQARPEADFWVGMEGGVEDYGAEMISAGWMAVEGHDGRIGHGRTSTFFLAPKVAALIREGHELGAADDIVFDKKNSKQDNGAVGILTGDVLTRTSYYADAIVLALIPFKNPQLYI